MPPPEPEQQPAPRAKPRGMQLVVGSGEPKQGDPLQPATKPTNLVELDILVLGVQAEDEGAMAEFYERASPLVMSVLLRLLRNRQAAEEVCVEVFVQVWRRSEQYDPRRGRAASWLMTIARSRGLDELRRERAKSATTVSLSEDPINPKPDAEPLAQLESSAVSASLQIALDKLPWAQREPLELSFLSGLSHHRISSRLGQPLGTIKTRIRLGLAALRVHLQPLGYQ